LLGEAHGDIRAGYLGQHIASFYARFGSRRTGDDPAYQDAFVHPRTLEKRLNADAKPRALHLAGLDDGLRYVARNIARDRASDPSTIVSKADLIDPDDLAISVDQGAAGVAGLDRGIVTDPPDHGPDILAVLLFGKPTRQLGSGESRDLQQHAIGLATTYATPKLVGSVTTALGIDRLDVTPSQGPGTTGAVRVGRYVVEDVFVSLAQEFGARAGQVVGVEYNLGRNISVRASTSSRGDSGIDLFWRRRY
jgi:hypothetical protein